MGLQALRTVFFQGHEDENPYHESEYTCNYELGRNGIRNGWLTESGIKTIQNNPGRMLGMTDDYIIQVVKKIVEAWWARGKSFELCAITRIYRKGEHMWDPSVLVS